MLEISYFDRKEKKVKKESVYGEKALAFVYGNSFFSRTLGVCFLWLSARFSWFSAFFGWWNKQPWTRKKAAWFIKKFHLNLDDFAPKPYRSFNDFFIRKLKPGARPIASSLAVMPADGRYLFFDNVDQTPYFPIKESKYTLANFLQDEKLALTFAGGTAILARLCPLDYHRFHFPVDGLAKAPQTILGKWYSVNPQAIRQRPSIFCENKRVITEITSDHFGKVLMVEVGATCVGTIHQTFTPNQRVHRGEEKGFFSFGGSSVVLLFQKGTIQLASDLKPFPKNDLETFCLMGEPLGDLA